MTFDKTSVSTLLFEVAAALAIFASSSRSAAISLIQAATAPLLYASNVAAATAALLFEHRQPSSDHIIETPDANTSLLRRTNFDSGHEELMDKAETAVLGLVLLTTSHFNNLDLVPIIVCIIIEIKLENNFPEAMR